LVFFQARVVNTLLAGFSGWMIWYALKRSEWIKTAPYRLLSLVLVLSGSVSTQTIRTIRPDTMMFTICAAVFLVWTIRPVKWRLPAVFLSSSLLLPAGLPMLPYSILMLALVLVSFGTGLIKTAAAALTGMVGGMGWLCLFYGHFSSIRAFTDIVMPFTIVGANNSSFASKLAIKFVGDAVDYPDTIFTSFFGNPFEFISPKTLFDYSSALLFLLIVGLTAWQWARLESMQKRLALFAVLMVLIVPPSLHIAAHYRSMYRWMTYMPLCVVVPCFVEAVLRGTKERAIHQAVGGILFATILLGVPARTILVLPWWSERSIGPLNEAAQRIVSKSDVVIGDSKVYFAVRPLAKTIFMVGLPARGRFDLIKDLPKSEITLLCLRPDEFEAMASTIGGNWHRVASGNPSQEKELEQTRYNVNFYRRSGTIKDN